jgi:hypothetical protein
MPLLGTRDIGSEESTAPEMPSLDTDSLTLERVEILQVMYEIASPPMLDLLPPALHPTIPPTVTWLVWRAGGGPLGPFTLAQTRIGSRAGVRPRGYLLSAVVDEPAVGVALASRWGYRCRVGEVALRRFHDRVDARVVEDGETTLECSVLDPEAISGGDVQYVASMHLARTPAGTRLVQVDPEYTFHRAERGWPLAEAFDAGAWGDDRVEPVHPVSAHVTIADVALPRLRYVSRPDVPAIEGTQKL